LDRKLRKDVIRLTQCREIEREREQRKLKDKLGRIRKGEDWK
jgi:hypothetical protein